MKNSWEWEEDDLLQLINLKIQESLELDYKACGALNAKNTKKNISTEISKDVSAFANSAGGVIVYGIHEKNNLPTGLDDGFDPKLTSREWLEQIINSKIQRRIDGVRIKQVELSGERKGRVAYVVSIPQSRFAPHQAADKLFYKRFEFQSIPMEEYEMRDIARRLSAPDLDLTVILHGSGSLVKESKDVEAPWIELQGVIANLSQQVAEYAIISIFVDDRLNVEETGGFKCYPTFMPFDGKSLNIKRLELNWSIPGKMPIFEGAGYQITKDRKFIKLLFPKNDIWTGEKYILFHHVQAPGMQPKTKYLIINVINGQAEIKKIDNLKEYASIKNLSIT
jgi:hypothetical protein